jgi:glutaredoxin
VKEFLSREGHAFVAKNVEEDHAAYTELLALGFRVVPVTVVHDRAITGFDERQLRAALSDDAES